MMPCPSTLEELYSVKGTTVFSREVALASSSSANGSLDWHEPHLWERRRSLTGVSLTVSMLAAHPALFQHEGTDGTDLGHYLGLVKDILVALQVGVTCTEVGALSQS